MTDAGNSRHCTRCNAAIPDDHIARRVAGLVDKKLLCAACIQELRRQIVESRSGLIQPPAESRVSDSGGILHAGSGTTAAPRTDAAPAPAPPQTPPASSGALAAPAHDDEPISLTDAPDPRKPTQQESKIRSFVQSSLIHGYEAAKLQRPVLGSGHGATRCRSFHGKLTDAALSFMDNQINEWIDNNPDIEIKFVASSIGVFEGKHSEPHLILTLFY